MSIKKSGGPISSEAAGGIKQQSATRSSSDEPVLCIEFQLSDGRVFGFPYSHLVHYRLEESADSDAGPEKLTLEFSRHNVLINGARLSGLGQLLQAGRLARLCEMDSRYENVASERPFISNVQVKSGREANA